MTDSTPTAAKGLHAIYPGTFDPFTLGHEDVAHRACFLFGRVTLAVAAGKHKNTLLTLQERLEMAQEAMADYPQVQVVAFEGLLADLVAQQEAQVLVRGIRSSADFDYEFHMAGMNQHLMPQVQTVFIPTRPHLQFVSGTFVREIARLGGPIHGLVSPAIEARLKAKLGS